jgi:hypothetical protein
MKIQGSYTRTKLQKSAAISIICAIVIAAQIIGFQGSYEEVVLTKNDEAEGRNLWTEKLPVIFKQRFIVQWFTVNVFPWPDD